jgi:hypothetical protein
MAGTWDERIDLEEGTRGELVRLDSSSSGSSGESKGTGKGQGKGKGEEKEKPKLGTAESRWILRSSKSSSGSAGERTGKEKVVKPKASSLSGGKGGGKSSRSN